MDSQIARIRRMIRRLAPLGGLGLIVLLLAGPARSQGYDAGVAAFEAGDLSRALRIWQPLADSGDAIAQYSLGKLYETGGRDVPKDYGRAVEWYRQAAAKGVAAAQNNLGLMYAQGRGVARDPARAAELWRDAARQNHPMGQFNLGLAYFRGDGIEPDKAQAELWFRRAAELGLAEAQYALGQIKLLGLTTEIDKGEALNWYQLAAAQGHDKARERAKALRVEGVKPTLPPPLSQLATRSRAKTMATAETAPMAAPAAKNAPAKATAEAAQMAARPAQETPALPPAPALEQPEPKRKTAKAPAVPGSAKAAGEAPVMRPKGEARLGPAARSAPAGATDGAYRIWLLSERSEKAAAAYLDGIMSRHAPLMAHARGYVEEVELGRGRKLYRAVAGGLPSQGAARALCHSLRSEAPGTFCKILAGRQQAN